MSFRGKNRLRVLLMSAAAIGVFGPQPFVVAEVQKFPAPSSNKKVASKTQPPATQPPSSVAATTEPAVLPVAQTQTPNGSKSEVQRQLELLYEQDGREMPEMNMTMQPVPLPGTADSSAKPGSQGTPNSTGANVQGGLRTQQPQTPRTGQQQPAVQQPTVQQPVTPPETTAAKPAGRSVMGFFKKLVPGNKEKASKAPSDYRPDIAPLPPETNAASQATRAPNRPHVDYAPAQLKTTTTIPPAGVPAAINHAGIVAKPISSNIPLPPLDNQPRMPFVPSIVASNQSSDFPPSPSGGGALPEISAAALPPLISKPLPPLSVVPESPTVAVSSATSPLQEEIPGSPAEPITRSDLVNPFTEMSEADADRKLEPFTGLTLDDSPNSTSSKPVAGNDSNTAKETIASKDAPDGDDPFAEELRQMGVLPPIVKEALQVPDKQATLTPPTPSDSPTFDGIEDQTTREKMRRIHERGSMKGLKGFCPVTLRDRRELVDAKPDFHSTHRGQKFHFADADSKLKFDEDPSQYAPAAYGADVVALTRDKDVVEGSLDFAAWFKGRLYLFGTQEAHDTFVGNPAQFATPVGIE